MLNLLSSQFSWLDFIDIVLVAILLYQLYQLVRGTVAINILVGVTLFYALWLVVRAMNMRLFSHILGKFIDVGFIALLIVFQQELRRFFIFVGTTNFISRGSLARRFFEWNMTGGKIELDIHSIAKACKNMSESHTGALIVITRGSDLKFYANTGDPIDAKVSVRMIESIFYKNSPLHDGALLITDNQLRAARCVLPVTEDPDFPAHLGMRHRAAVGITENSDALAIVVSEQTGEISFAKDGKIVPHLTPDKLKELLEKNLGE
ncbi:MAG TPA: diadenylate cyclase CdaA [Bacteroidia bacterium]|jgi:diadenylate cyclase|nr:diadenylate cyclase CdaA [Bacteroidia bacterium]